MGDTIAMIFLIIVSAVCIIGGILLKSNADGSINETIGYRTARSVKNAETQRFANEYSGKLLIKCGVVSAVLSVLLEVFLLHFNVSGGWLISCLAEIALVLTVTAIVIVSTEKQLKNKFEEK
ncbi:MAG: SdpI family protein [Ruminococcus sp.]|nr:SdpI family protein [Ruminococcus sp.]